MRKFTLFTIFLAVVVVIAAFDLLSNQYGNKSAEELKLAVPRNLDLSKAVTTDVTGAAGDIVSDDGQVAGNSETAAENITSDNSDPSAAPNAADFEDTNYTSALPDIYLRPEQIKSAGFVNAKIEVEPSESMLFKTIYVGDLNDVEMVKYGINGTEKSFAKVYVFKIGPKADVSGVYDALKLRAAEGVDSEVNETNSYGDASFFVNDSKRQNTAFIVVKIGQLIYGFSYPKDYHPQVKNLIKLLEWEFKK